MSMSLLLQRSLLAPLSSASKLQRGLDEAEDGAALLSQPLSSASRSTDTASAASSSSSFPSSSPPSPSSDAHSVSLSSSRLSESPAPGYESDSKFSEDELLHTRTLLLSGSDVARKREELRSYFHRTFSLYEALFDLLTSDAAFLQQPDSLRHPLIFYYGHTAVFFVNKLLLSRQLSGRVDAAIEATCAIGVDEMSWDDVEAKHYDWPSVQAVADYRDRVRVLVDRLISRTAFTLPIDWQSPLWPLLMGIEHERIHLETSSVLFRQLPLQHIRPQPRLFRLCPTARRDPAAVPPNRLVAVPGGRVTLGRGAPDAGGELQDTYGWDNEYGLREAEVPSFSAGAFLVSNAEFLQFVQAGGYQQAQWWGQEGWRYVQYRQLEAPLFWLRQPDSSFRYRALAEETPMPWDWPVDVNYLEAKAFCNWKSRQCGLPLRLPTEDEWRRMRDWAFPAVAADGARNDQPYWSAAPGNLNLEHFASACPVDLFPFGSSGLHDVVGNVWQHSETAISGLRGFRCHPLYDDFSVPTFDGRHNLLLGGSFISTGNEATRHARYAFRRHFMQHAGFRYVASDAPLPSPEQQLFTESDPAICAAIHAHFAPQPLGLPNFYQALARVLIDAVRQQRMHEQAGAEEGGLSVLELGCGVGRTCFELAASGLFSRVLGLDRTARLIRLASHLQLSGSGLQYCLVAEGELLSHHEAELRAAGLQLTAEQLRPVRFLQADADNLDAARHFPVSCLVMSCVLEEMQQPAAFLSSAHLRLQPRGLLLVASSFAWDEQRTAKERWLGGRRENGESCSSERSLQLLLTPHFSLLQPASELPRLQRLSDRQARLSTVQLSLWRRRD